MIVKRDPAGTKAIPVGQDKPRRQRLVGILLIGHDHQDIWLLGHAALSSNIESQSTGEAPGDATDTLARTPDLRPKENSYFATLRTSYARGSPRRTR